MNIKRRNLRKLMNTAWLSLHHLKPIAVKQSVDFISLFSRKLFGPDWCRRHTFTLSAADPIVCGHHVAVWRGQWAMAGGWWLVLVAVDMLTRSLKINHTSAEARCSIFGG